MPNPLRVLTIAPDLGFGGGENRILNLARSADAQKIKLTVATLYSHDPAWEAAYGSLHPEFVSAGINVVSLKLSRPNKHFNIRLLQMIQTACTLARAAVRLSSLIARMDVDLIDAHMDGSLLLAVAAAVAACVPVVVTLYHVQTIPPNPLLQPVRLVCMRFANAIITDSQARADDFAAALPISHPPIQMIPNGVRLEPSGRSREEILKHFGLPENAENIIGQVSGFVPFKGHRILLDAAKRVLAEEPQAYFVCVGFDRNASAYIDALRKQAEELGIAARVRFGSYPGPISEVWKIIDFHVHASTLDSLPNAILESMSLGKPAVVTAVGGIPDAVLDQVSGLVVPPGDATSLAEALLRLLTDKQLSARLGAEAKARYLRNYTPECCARAVERLFVGILRAEFYSRMG